MRVWVLSFVLFFSAAELYQWLQKITLPFPVFVIAGALLAIASNVNQLKSGRSIFTVAKSEPVRSEADSREC